MTHTLYERFRLVPVANPSRRFILKTVTAREVVHGNWEDCTQRYSPGQGIMRTLVTVFTLDCGHLEMGPSYRLTQIQVGDHIKCTECTAKALAEHRL